MTSARSHFVPTLPVLLTLALMTLPALAADKPVKVYILSGQSIRIPLPIVMLMVTKNDPPRHVKQFKIAILKHSVQCLRAQNSMLRHDLKFRFR